MSKPILAIGSRTRWGKIAAIGLLGGERYYWMVDGNCVSMMPADAVEARADAERESSK